MKHTYLILFLFCSGFLYSQEPSNSDTAKTPEPPESAFVVRWRDSSFLQLQPNDSLTTCILPNSLLYSLMPKSSLSFNYDKLFLSSLSFPTESHFNSKKSGPKPEKIEPAKQLEASLRIISVPRRVYSRFPAPTNPDEKRQLRIIEIVSVGLVIALILYLLFRKRKSF